MLIQKGSDGTVYKVGFTRARKNGKRRHIGTIRADTLERAIELFKQIIDEHLSTNNGQAGKYELCTGDWSVITIEELY